jgi:antitoxin YefM
MDITSYTQFRQNLKMFLDQVTIKGSPLFVTRSNAEEVVVISKSEYESLNETFYLLKSPNNAKRLHRALNEYKDGKGVERDLLEGH